MKCVGIFREVLHSPQREKDDYEILRLTGEKCAQEGLNVSLFEPDEFLNASISMEEPTLLFLMCEQDKILKKIAFLEAAGALAVNSTQSIRNTYRTRTIPLWEKNKVSYPASKLVSTISSHKNFNGFAYPFWVKRGDVHNTQPGDVLLVRTQEECQKALEGLLGHSISDALLQAHIEGDLVKFYGVGRAPQLTWFNWFYHKGQNLKNIPFNANQLKQKVELAAASLGLEVFGGDAVIQEDGQIFLIDMNAWPSFALFREEASTKIAQYLALRLNQNTLSSLK